MACNLSPGQAGVTQTSDDAPAGDASATTEPGTRPSPTPETMTVTMLEEGEVEIPIPPPMSLDALLDQGVDDGAWDYGQGLVLLLSYVAVESGPDDIPGFEMPQELSPTGIVRQAQEYLDDPNSDPEYRDEIERLLGVLVPTQSDLDRLSRPAEQSDGGISLADLQLQEDIPPECADIASLGFKAGLNPGDYCYVYEEASQGGHRLRVYYPKWWQDEPERKVWADTALKSLADSARVYSKYGRFGDVNAVFSLTQLLGGLHSLAFATGFPPDQPCPVVILPLINTNSQDDFLQTVAHEAFHCYQNWNMNLIPYRFHRWWAEGSAEYFSNVVYPEINYEHRWLNSYYLHSLYKPWFDLDYENFLLFQFLANKLGSEGLLIMLDKVSSSGDIQAQAQTLANYGDLDALFEEFVVASMSAGVLDSSGSRILKKTFPVIRIEPVDKEGEEQFLINPFVAGRFGLRYLKDRRFLEEPVEDEHVHYSSVARGELRNLEAWSALPPEVRSRCDRDQHYALAVTSVDGAGSFIAKINKVEEGACDACLLGTWDVDPDSFAAYFQRVAQSGGQQPGASLEVSVSGHNYVVFKPDYSILTRRADFRIRIASSGSPGVITSLDTQGSASYTADGEKLDVWNVHDTTNSITTTVEGTGLTISQTPDQTTYSFFGDSSSTRTGLPDDEAHPKSSVGAYTCTDKTLNITTNDFGDVLFHRVEEILPTPVPTAGP